MTTAPGKMLCPSCGVEMNHHAEKLVYKTGAESARAADSGLGGLVEEFHTCPNCGHTESRAA